MEPRAGRFAETERELLEKCEEAPGGDDVEGRRVRAKDEDQAKEGLQARLLTKMSVRPLSSIADTVQLAKGDRVSECAASRGRDVVDKSQGHYVQGVRRWRRGVRLQCSDEERGGRHQDQEEE